MSDTANESVTVETVVAAPVSKVWDCYTDPAHIVLWNSAAPDWHTPRAENDVRVGGRFLSRMEAKDGSEGFDFTGMYTEVIPHQKIAYVMDGEGSRKAMVLFDDRDRDDATKVMVTFDIEHENPVEMQRAGWQAILDNFKAHVESEHALDSTP